MKVAINKSIRDEKGQALLLVLVLMVVGGLIIAPLLSYMSTGLIAGRVYEEIADELYAADAGVEDGLWQIKYNHLSDLFGDYDLYDYDAVYDYPTGYPLEVNDIDVVVTIENIWIPQISPVPSPDDARQLIGAGKLIITDSVPAELTQQIKIYYYKETDDPDLEVTKLGIWLPPGFNYHDVAGGCNLETYLDPDDWTRAINPHCGGEAVVWTFLDTVLFTELPGVNPLDFPMTSTITFKFTSSQPNRSPEAVSWIITDGVDDIPYTWDADVKVYHIVSQANGEDGTTVDAYAVKSEMRELGSAISGDYRAIGATLMTDKHYSRPPKRDTLLGESDATADDIPANAYVEAAWLYWSAWLASDTAEDILFWDDCSNMSKWIPGGDWRPDGGRFRGQHTGNDPDKYLTMQDSIDLSSCSPGAVTVSWQQDASWWVDDTDCLKFAFSADDGSTWGDWNIAFCDDNPPSTFSYVIPDEYLTDSFKMAFYLDGFSGSYEYCYIDNIKISVPLETIADISAIFKVNDTQVYFAEDADGNLTVPTIGDEEIIAKKWSVLENRPGEYSYACYLDVTELVRLGLETTPPYTTNGNGTYTVGDVYGDTDNEWSYAAWSLIIIYSSPQTKGHQLYLYDDFTYVDNNETLEFPISGFLVPDPIRDPDTGEIIEENAATLTCFVGEGDDYYDWDYLEFNGTALSDGKSTDDVWNSWSYGLAEDGIDIDTFYVTWDSDLLEPGDTSAQVDLPTGTDSWNLVYIIISFRSETTTGGTVTYLIRG